MATRDRYRWIRTWARKRWRLAKALGLSLRCTWLDVAHEGVRAWLEKKREGKNGYVFVSKAMQFTIYNALGLSKIPSRLGGGVTALLSSETGVVYPTDQIMLDHCRRRCPRRLAAANRFVRAPTLPPAEIDGERFAGGTTDTEVENRLELIELALSFIRDRDADVVRRRFGLGEYGGREWLLQEVGDLYGLSRERVRQIERRALLRLYAVITSIEECGLAETRRRFGAKAPTAYQHCCWWE